MNKGNKDIFCSSKRTAGGKAILIISMKVFPGYTMFYSIPTYKVERATQNHEYRNDNIESENFPRIVILMGYHSIVIS